MTTDPMFSEGTLSADRLRVLLREARDAFVFGELRVTGAAGGSVTFVAGRVSASWASNQRRPRADDHTGASMREQVVSVFTRMLADPTGDYSFHPLVGMAPADLRFTYDAVELFEAAAELLAPTPPPALPRRAEPAGGAPTAAGPLPPLRDHQDLAHLASRAEALRLSLEEPDRPVAAAGEAGEAGKAAEASEEPAAIVGTLDHEPASTRRGALRRLIRSLAS